MAAVAGTVAGLVVVLAITAYALYPKGHHATSSRVDAAVAASLPTAPSGLSDNALALDLTVQPRDISPRWVSLRAENYPAADLNASLSCLPASRTGHRSAGAIHEYSLDLQSNGLESGHLVSAVFLQASAADASVTRNRLLTTGVDTCAQADAIAQISGAGVTGAHITATNPLDSPNGLTGVAERLDISFMFRGTPETVTTDIFDLVDGRVEFQMLVQQCSCSPFDPSLETGLIQTVDNRAQASSYAQ